MKSYFHGWKHAFSFAGTSSRTSFWTFFFVQLVGLIALSWVERRFGVAEPDLGMGPYSAAYLIASLFPLLALAVRRLHDQRLSGWFVLLIVIPIIGILALTFLMLRPGTTPGLT
jgi:uncharacterized membrane protein YhaH (DUF805 family)